MVAGESNPALQSGVTLEFLRECVRAPKAISTYRGWSALPAKDSTILTLVATLAVGNIVRQGLRLRGATIAERPDSDLTFQLEWTPAVGPTYHLLRYDWRPLRPHRNRGRGPEQWRYLDMWTHYHPFEENVAEGMEALYQGNLPIGIPIDPDLESVDEAIEKLGELFNIAAPREIPVPPWQPRLIS